MNALQIASIRQLFPDNELYYIIISGDEYVFRVITPQEYSYIKEIASNQYDEEDLITQTALIYPPDYVVSNGKAGVPRVASRFILEFSMLGEKYAEDRAIRGQAYIEDISTNAESQIPILIKMAFPEFKFEEIEAWTIDVILKRFAQALWALDKRGIDVSMYNVEYKPGEPKSVDVIEKEIREAGGDPVLELYSEYKPVVNIVESPFLGGLYWDNEEIIDAIQQQIHKPRQVR